MKKPLALIILDGFGVRKEERGNAIIAAHKPNIDKYIKENPVVTIGASGMDVGLPDGQMGNSEVGHTNIGAGRIVYQELTRITKAIDEGDFFKNEAMQGACKNVKEHNSALHVMGLLSDGGVHSHINHLKGVLRMAKNEGIEKVYLHCFMDGRDVAPTSGVNFVKEIKDYMEELGVGKIATISGRYYAMDRDNRWERVIKAYNAIANGEGNFNPDPVNAVEESYKAGVTDEFIVPTVTLKGAEVEPHDSIVFFNFRPDRARELTRTFADEAFAGFERKKGFMPLYYVCMTQYDATMPNVNVAFKPQSLKNTFGEYVSEKGLTQLRIAETEKYAHVTFFFNGGVEAPYKNEDRALINSPKVATYDLQPEMSAYEVTDELLARLDSDKYDVIILNFANTDMVGHTGVFEAAVKAVETVDECLGKIIDKILEKDGAALVTADHGNVDKMFNEDGSPFTAHTTNPVPLILIGGKGKRLDHGGRLADLAPTMLDLLGLPQPEEMTGRSLIIK